MRCHPVVFDYICVVIQMSRFADHVLPNVSISNCIIVVQAYQAVEFMKYGNSVSGLVFFSSNLGGYSLSHIKPSLGVQI